MFLPVYPFLCYSTNRKDYVNRLRSIIVLSCVAFLCAGCGDADLFSPFGDDKVESRYIDLSVEAGAVLMPGAVIEIRKKGEWQTLPIPDRMLVTILDRDSRSVGSAEFTQELLDDELPPVTLEESHRGYHLLRYELFDAENQIIESGEIPFFTESYLPEIPFINIVPAASLEPGTYGLLFTNVGENPDFFLRWSLEGEPFAFGLAGDFKDGALLTAPGRDGVYTVLLELFPEPPPENCAGDYPFSSPFYRTMEFYVDSTASTPGSDLFPDGSHEILFHFYGSLDPASNTLSSEIRRRGTPRPFVRNGTFGYRFAVGDRLEIDLKAAEDRSSITIDHIFEPLEKDADTSVWELTKDGEIVLSAGRDSSSIPYILLPARKKEVQSPERLSAGIAAIPSSIVGWSVSLDGRRLVVSCSIDHHVVKTWEDSSDGFDLAAPLALCIGGQAPLFLDELGVHVSVRNGGVQ